MHLVKFALITIWKVNIKEMFKNLEGAGNKEFVSRSILFHKTYLQATSSFPRHCEQSEAIS